MGDARRRRPDYDPVSSLTDDGWVTVPGILSCSACGAAVDNWVLHTEWHHSIDVLLELANGAAS